jgi:hypothetical protein
MKFCANLLEGCGCLFSALHRNNIGDKATPGDLVYLMTQRTVEN